MSRGKRYNGEAKLNMKKVLAVLVALLVIVMFVFVIYKLVTNGKGERMTNNYYFTFSAYLISLQKISFEVIEIKIFKK